MKTGRVLLLLGLAGLFAAGQETVRAHVEGQVTNRLTGAPVKDATVVLRGPWGADQSAPSVTVQSDEHGHFVFDRVLPGSYSLTATHAGYVPESLGSPVRPRDLITVAAQKPANVLVKLTPRAVLAGKVVDDDGNPVQGATVGAVAVVWYPGGGMVWKEPGRTVQTDDRGMFRIAELEPDTYTLVVTPPVAMAQWRDPQGRAYPRTYLGGSADPQQAEFLTLDPGEVRTAGLGLKRAAVARIRGRIIEPSGIGSGGAGQFELTRKGAWSPMAGVVALRQTDGSFEIDGVLPGQYELSVTVNDRQERVSGSQTLNVQGDLDDVRIALSAARSLSGKVSLEQAPGIDVGRLSVVFEAIPSRRLTAASRTVNVDGTFAGALLTAGRYAVQIGQLPPGAYVKSVLSGGREVPAGGLDPASGEPLAVTVGKAQAASLDIAVVDAAGKAAPDRRVTLIPLDGVAMSAAFSPVNGEGRASFLAIRPGKYLATAWETDVDAFLLQAAGTDALQPVEAWSKTIELRPGGNQSIQLTAVSAAESRKAFSAR